MLKKLFSSVLTLSMIFIGLFAIAGPARATGASSDATLNALEVHADDAVRSAAFYTKMAIQPFSPNQDFYDVYSPDQTFLVYVRPTDSGATATITGGDANGLPMATNSDIDGYSTMLKARVTVAEASNQLVRILVTAADGVTTKQYTLNVSSGVNIAQPQVISNSVTEVSTSGGTMGVLYLKNWTKCATYALKYDYRDASGDLQTQTDAMTYPRVQYVSTDSNGISKVIITYSQMYRTFRDDSVVADLIVANDTAGGNNCVFNWYSQQSWIYASASTTLPKSIHFFNPTVTSTTMPETISQDSIFTISGPGITYNAQGLYFSVFNPATGNSLGLESRLINNNRIQLTVSPYNAWGDWLQDQNLQLIVTDNPVEGFSPATDSVVLFRKNVKFTPEMASAVSVSPAKGPTQGGNTVTISGHGICNTLGAWATIKIGGVVVYSFNGLTCDMYGSSDKIARDGLSSGTFVVPAGPAGPADITVDMGYGPTTLSQKYIYGATPTVSSITPSTVANTGGSIVTLNGANFGISGTPVVIIDGQKSPFVTRISPTKVRAMVPASTSVGPVDVDILSSSGGGGLTQKATLTYAARSANPTVTSISPASGGLSGGTSVVISGSGFSSTASGVTFDGRAAKVVIATATSLTVEAPGGRATGPADVSVATPTGLATVNNGFNYTPDPGVTSVSPATIASYATGSAANISIAGNGFGASGKITIGSAPAIDYTASSGGTLISGISIPTNVAGRVEVSILPAGATKPFVTSVSVTAPKITFFGPRDGGIIPGDGDPDTYLFGDNDPWMYRTWMGWGAPLAAANNGGDVMLITGSGFGNSGQVKIGNTVVQVLSYSDTRITFASPSGVAAGTYDLRVIPTGGTLVGSIANAVTVGTQLAAPHIALVRANTRPSNGDPLNFFWPNTTDSDLYTITGSGFSGSDSGASTKVYMQGATDFWAGNSAWNLVNVVSKTDTEIVVRIPRNLDLFRWNALQIVTNQTTVSLSNAVYYNDVPPPPISGGSSSGGGSSQTPGSTLDQTLYSGLCNSTPIGSRNPAVVTFTNDFNAFGASGTVYLGSTAITSDAIDWATDGSAVTVNFASTDITDVWGPQFIQVASATLDARFFNFACSVTSTVTTTINGQTSDLTVNAGTPIALASTLNNPLPGTTWVEPSTNYEYQTAAAHGANGPYMRGIPTSPGDYYVRARIAGAAFDGFKYSSLTPVNSVHLVIVGLNINLTPHLVGGGNSIVYKGQLGDGTNGTRNDIGFTPSPAQSEPITGVVYQYRNHAYNDPQLTDVIAWNTGLPKDVALLPSCCGGDGTTIGSWDIRVKSFEMASSGVDRSVLYVPQFDVFNLTITRAPLTLTAVSADKTYNGDNSVTLGEITVTGALQGEYPTLASSVSQGATFADPNVGIGKPVTLVNPIALSGQFALNYSLTNPSLGILGNIVKADDILRLEPSVTSVVLGQTATVDLTVTTTDVLTGQPPISQAGVNAPVLVSATPSICSLSGTTVTPIAAGDCVIEATQAASDNYNAGVSFHKSPSLTESVKIKIYPGAVIVSVIADDIKVAVGSSVSASATATGLLNADTFDGVTFTYYQGSTRLSGAPTAIGVYRIVPSGGSVTTQTQIAYSSTVRYIEGLLIITDVPPTITSIAPGHGPEAGGNRVVITGTGFGALTSINLGEKTIRKPNFTVNGDGTQVSFILPPGVGGLDIVLNAGDAEAEATYAYDAPYAPPATVPNNGGTAVPPTIIAIAPANGPESGGNTVVITGTGLEALTSIVLGTNPIDGSGFTVNSAGTQVSFIAPAGTGTQDLTLVAGLLETTVIYTYRADFSAPAPGQAVGLAINGISPAHGPEAGGNIVAITGSGFGALTSITLGSKVLHEPDYSISGNGSQVTFKMPAGTGTLHISLNIGDAHTDVVYTYETSVKGGGQFPSHLVLMIDLAVGAKLAGQKVAMNGGGLAPNSAYSLVLRSTPQLLFKGVTDAQGYFDQKFVVQTNACITPGKHTFELHAVTPDGKEVVQTAVFSLLGNCKVGGTVEKTAAKQVTLSGFLFDFRSSVLTSDGKQSLGHLITFLKGAKAINILGYTETDTKSIQVKAANLKLAKARALAVQAYLKAKGVVAKWSTIGKGGINPVSVIDQYKNRRVEIQANF